jgi:hypothetical protein
VATVNDESLRLEASGTSSLFEPVAVKDGAELYEAAKA